MNISTLEKIIDYQKTAYISSVDSQGFPNTKAMLTPRKRNGIKEFYLSTNTSSLKVSNFKNNSKACLYFCDNRFFRGIMFRGNIELLDDPDSKKRIWLEGDEMYYSKGITDPDFCVLKFTAIDVRYYSHFKSETSGINEL